MHARVPQPFEITRVDLPFHEYDSPLADVSSSVKLLNSALGALCFLF